MSHTPGPWCAIADPCHFNTISEVIGGEHAPENNLHHELMVSVGGFDATKQEANAHLIAAAPELLEALKEIVDVVAVCSSDEGKTTYEVCQTTDFSDARAAIAKAEGQS